MILQLLLVGVGFHMLVVTLVLFSCGSRLLRAEPTKHGFRFSKILGIVGFRRSVLLWAGLVLRRRREKRIARGVERSCR